MLQFRPHTLVLLAAGALACGDGAVEPITDLPRPLTSDEAALVAADNGFAFQLFGTLAATNTDSNLFVSPLSVGMALGMTYNGAAGATAEAMRQTLGFGALTRDQINASYRSLIDLLRGLDTEVEFTIANSVWYREGETIDPAFVDRAGQFFDATVQPLDFAAANAAAIINQWVSDATNARITEIVDARIPPNVIAYLINAIYFKGSWTYQFPKAATQSGPFHLADGSTRNVPMMHGSDEIPVLHGSSTDADVLELAYGGGAYRMTIVLPHPDVGLDSLVQSLTKDRWDAWVAGLDSTLLLVTMPKFQMEYERSLIDALKSLGMAIGFCDYAGTPEPDFTDIFPKGACISAVKHKTWVDVNEEGTEAAAVTSVELGRSGIATMVVDRPFLFAIREAFSGSILFIGRMVDPGAG